MNYITILFKGQEDVSSTKIFHSEDEAKGYINWSFDKINYCSNNLTYSISHARIDKIDGFGRYTKGNYYIFNDIKNIKKILK